MVFEDYDPEDIDHLACPNGNPVMSVFLLTDMEENVKGILVNYTSHPAVVCGEDWLYTRDYILSLIHILDALVLNAVARTTSDWNCPKEEYEESMKVNATGLFLATRTLGDTMVDQKHGSIIIIGSMQGMICLLYTSALSLQAQITHLR